METMANNTAEILNRGMECLRTQLGIIEAETFISIVIREQFDYTKWHDTAFEGKTLNEFIEEAAENENKHPFNGAATVI